MRVHSALPDALTTAVEAALAGVEHVAHGGGDDMGAAEATAGDAEALALIGPIRSRAVAEALEATRARRAPAARAGGDVTRVSSRSAECPVVERAAAAGLPVVAFDGIQDGIPLPDLRLALPFAPGDDLVSAARRAAELVTAAVRGGARDRSAMLAALRELGPFDEHGDPLDPPVWLWRAEADWSLRPDRPLQSLAS